LVKRLPGADSAPWGVVDASDIASFADRPSAMFYQGIPRAPAA
jgi:hypothetical protein